MIIYIDVKDGYKCHSHDNGALLAYESEGSTEFFANKSKEFIEGYRCIPHNMVFVGDDGTEYSGEQITPWKRYSELYTAQLEHENTDMKAALEVMEVEAE